MLRKGTAELSTARLLLRRYLPGDSRPAFENWASDEKSAEFWSWEPHKNESTVRALVDIWIAQYCQSDYYNWAIVLKETMQPVGYIYLDDTDDISRSAYVHFLLGSRWWNQGLMTEALGKVIDFALQEAGFERILSFHHVRNAASGRVMEKCGMRLTEEKYRSSSCANLSGTYRFYMIEKNSP